MERVLERDQSRILKDPCCVNFSGGGIYGFLVGLRFPCVCASLQ